MSTAIYAPRRTTQQWQAIFDDWAASGLSQRAFCEAKGIKYGTFTQRRRALQASGAAATPQRPTKAAPELIELTLPAQQPEPVAAAAMPPATTTGGWDLELELGPGLILRLQQR